MPIFINVCSTLSFLCSFLSSKPDISLSLTF
jgi:hypothetical protein